MALLVMKPTIVATLTVQLSLLIISNSIISPSKCDQTTTGTTSNITTIIDLHHPDLSPRSPRYDPSLSHYQRVANALQRSSNRRNLASTQTPSAAPPIENNDGYYFLNYSIGINPSVALQGILSTASDLIWTPCSNLDTRSQSFQTIACNNPRCNSLPGSFCDKKRRCAYKMAYADGSSYKVYLHTGTITLGSVHFPSITFGCVIINQVSNGFVGLGGGAVSLVKQIGIGKFSYCLVSIDSNRTNSTLQLGDGAAVVQGAASIPFYIGHDPASYNVKLASITIGGGQKKKKPVTLTFGKNMILDTGTGSTYLPRTFYDQLLDTLRTSIGTDNVTDPHDTFDLCYSKAPGNKFPDITLKFENNVDVKWKQENVFAPMDPNTWCFAAFPIDEREEAIFGNLAQANFWVEFDLNKRTVTMTSTDCGRSN